MTPNSRRCSREAEFISRVTIFLKKPEVAGVARAFSQNTEN
jgi:hypothetical protein